MRNFLCWSVALMSCISLSSAVYAEDFHLVHESLRNALTCEGNPIKAVDRLIQQGVSNYQSGYAATEFGEETSYRAAIVLKDPLILAGAYSTSVIREIEQSHFDFDGIIYGRFRGDYRRVVETLKLSPISKTMQQDAAPFQRRLSTDIDGQPDTTCPKVIKLRPLENGEFLLGCGWCNG